MSFLITDETGTKFITAQVKDGVNTPSWTANRNFAYSFQTKEDAADFEAKLENFINESTFIVDSTKVISMQPTLPMTGFNTMTDDDGAQKAFNLALAEGHLSKNNRDKNFVGHYMFMGATRLFVGGEEKPLTDILQFKHYDTRKYHNMLKDYKTIFLPSINSFISVHKTEPNVSPLLSPNTPHNDGNPNFYQAKDFDGIGDSEFAQAAMLRLSKEDVQLIWDTFKIEIGTID